jgi:hypothetical protein
MKRILPVFLALAATASLWAQTADPSQDAKAIMKKVRERAAITTTQTRVRMQMFEKGAPAGERLIDQFMVMEKGLGKTAVIFQAPASVKDTRFLSIQKASGEEDRWIYLPALGKVRRVAAGESGSSFMGTDFSYDDVSTMTSRPLELDDYAFLRSDTLNGQKVFVIEVKPKDQALSAYSKTVQYIVDGTWLSAKTEIYGKDGTLIKVSETSEFRQIDGYWTPVKTTMTNVVTGHSTSLSIEKMIYNKPIPAGVFTTRFLETGRP